MAPVNFVDTIDQMGVSSPCKWLDIYDFISAAKHSNNPQPIAVRDSDKEFNDTYI